MNGVNAKTKVVKLYIKEDEDKHRYVWVGFEILHDITPNIGDIMDRAFVLLRGARERFHDRLQND